MAVEVAAEVYECDVFSLADNGVDVGGYNGAPQQSKNRGKTTKMDGLWFQTLLKWMIWGVKNYFLETPI